MFQTSTSNQRRILIHDLESTYAFLEDNIGSATGEDIVQIRDGALFLNVESPDTDTWVWDEGDRLVFETHDMGNSVRYVRAFLLPYSKLLRAAGVLQVYHPQYIANPAADSESSKLESIRLGFNGLRIKEALTDVVFIPRTLEEGDNAGDEESQPGDQKPLVAHRSFLAVFSEYFADAFCGGFAESRTASSVDPVRMDVLDYSRECVELVLGLCSLSDAVVDRTYISICQIISTPVFSRFTMCNLNCSSKQLHFQDIGRSATFSKPRKGRSFSASYSARSHWI